MPVHQRQVHVLPPFWERNYDHELVCENDDPNAKGDILWLETVRAADKEGAFGIRHMECGRIMWEFEEEEVKRVRVVKLRSWAIMEAAAARYEPGSVRVMALRGHGRDDLMQFTPELHLTTQSDEAGNTTIAPEVARSALGSMKAKLAADARVEIDACYAGSYAGAQNDAPSDYGFSNGLQAGLAQTLSKDLFPSMEVVASTVSYNGFEFGSVHRKLKGGTDAELQRLVAAVVTAVQLSRVVDAAVSALVAYINIGKAAGLDLDPRARNRRLGLGAAGAEAVAAVLKESRLRYLDLRYNEIGDKGTAAVARALPTSPVVYLSLRGNEIGPPGAAAVARTLQTSQVIHLDLSDNHIGDAGAVALARALPTSPVEYLNLGFSNQIGDPGAEALARALPTSRIAHLDLFLNQIGPQGAAALARALPTSQVAYLSLNQNHIGDSGAAALARALPTSPGLVRLNLYMNQIGDSGAVALALALPTSRVAYLDLYDNQIGAEAAARLKAHAPKHLHLFCDDCDPTPSPTPSPTPAPWGFESAFNSFKTSFGW